MKYNKVTQKKYCCCGACLEMILNRLNIKNNGQEDIAYDLGLVVPLEDRSLFKKVRVEEKPIAGYGTQVQNEEYSINNFFRIHDIPLIEEYHYITDIEEAKKFLSDNNENDIMICFHCATLYDNPQTDWGHMVLYDHLDGDYIILQEPSVKRDIEKIKIEKVIEAIKNHGKEKGSGFYLIKKLTK